jgi:hypothetical protein
MPHKRKKKQFRTQGEVDMAIKTYIARALRSEVLRDLSKYESPQYWKHHDTAVKWHNKAASLMHR